jgi:hypothetical protein
VEEAIRCSSASRPAYPRLADSTALVHKTINSDQLSSQLPPSGKQPPLSKPRLAAKCLRLKATLRNRYIPSVRSRPFLDPFMIHEAFPTLTETAFGSHPRCVVSVTYGLVAPFHGDDAGSNRNEMVSISQMGRRGQKSRAQGVAPVGRPVSSTCDDLNESPRPFQFASDLRKLQTTQMAMRPKRATRGQLRFRWVSIKDITLLFAPRKSIRFR